MHKCQVNNSLNKRTTKKDEDKITFYNIIKISIKKNLSWKAGSF